MKIGITGAEGLLGWHLSCYLKGLKGIEVRRANRSSFESLEKLNEFAHGCDAIVHLAGMNRGDEQVVAETNLQLTKKLIDVCQNTDRKVHLLFSSSTHIYKNTLYG